MTCRAVSVAPIRVISAGMVARRKRVPDDGVVPADDVDDAGGEADLVAQPPRRWTLRAASSTEGLTTIGQPAAIAGPSLYPRFSSGKFQARKATATPIGSRTRWCLWLPARSNSSWTVTSSMAET